MVTPAVLAWKQSAKVLEVMCILLSEQQCLVVNKSVLSEQGVGRTPHFTPQSDRGENKMPPVLCTTVGHQRKGKEKGHDRGSSSQHKFPNKGTSPPWVPQAVTPPRPSPSPITHTHIHTHTHARAHTN